MPVAAPVRASHRPAACERMTGLAAARPSPPPRLLDRVRTALRTRHYSARTEKAYVGWIRRFIVFHGKRHPSDLAEPEITAFISSLADDILFNGRRSSPSSARGRSTEASGCELANRALQRTALARRR
jgi:hypothetical protein